MFIMTHQSGVPDNVGEHDGGKLACLGQFVDLFLEYYHRYFSQQENSFSSKKQYALDHLPGFLILDYF